MKSNSYSYLSKVMHKQFLQEKEIVGFLLNRIQKKSKSFDYHKTNNTFITGLARAGTTALLQSLDSTNVFSSFRYKYMPFILSPSLAKFYSKYFQKNDDNKKERIHGDGLKISSLSPECLDEPFWINTEYKKYNFSKTLFPHELNEKTIREYGFLINSFSEIEGKKRSLIKNNNNHLRLISLSSYFLNSTFLIVFRSPIAQAKSLLNLHKRLKNIQNNDNYVLKYMNLIGHWEFGKGKKFFTYKEFQKDILNSLDDKEIEYWLHQWIYTYEWILEIYSKSKNSNLKLVCYEDLCKNKQYKSNLFHSLEVDNQVENFSLHLGKSNLIDKTLNLDLNLTKYAFEIYENLRKESKFF